MSEEMPRIHLCMGQNEARGTQVLVQVSVYQGSILGTYFWPTAIFPAGLPSAPVLP